LLPGSRYCEGDRLSETAWSLFGKTPLGWARPGYLRLRSPAYCLWLRTRPGLQDSLGSILRSHGRLPGLCAPRGRVVSLHEHPGALLHRLSRRYRRAGFRCTDGFLSLVRRLSRRRIYTFDARNNIPRIGWVLIARGRDGGGRRISRSFGPNALSIFTVWTEKGAEVECPGRFRAIAAARSPLEREHGQR
jgi:hypothetical protein